MELLSDHKPTTRDIKTRITTKNSLTYDVLNRKKTLAEGTEHLKNFGDLSSDCGGITKAE
jgi:hypothetical protein